MSKSFSLDIVSCSPLQEQTKTFIYPVTSLSASTSTPWPSVIAPYNQLKEEKYEENKNQHQTMRRWSFSDKLDQQYNDDNDKCMDLKYLLICNAMKVSLVQIITDIVSLWYVLPDCQLTFASIINGIVSKERSDAIAMIDILKLKKLRKYYWRWPLKNVVQEYLANSQKEENELNVILNKLHSAVICGDSNVSFQSFVEYCKNNHKIGHLTISLNSTNSHSPIHLFILIKPTTYQHQHHHNALQRLLIHIFLSNKKSNEGQTNDAYDSNKKLVMEVIGRSRPKKSMMNRQCLSDLIALTSNFVKKRKAFLRL